jgi:hypothetical protein
MSSFIDNGVWDKNGACVECGFMPFNLTEFCTECNPINIVDDVKNNCAEEIIKLEDDLHEQGINYIINNAKGINYLIDNDVKFIINNKEQFDEFDKLLREYKHMEYSVCNFTHQRKYYPQEQLTSRVQEYIYCGKWSSGDKKNVCEDEIKYAEDVEIPVTWEINREKTIIIDEDKSSYDEMFKSLENHNETGNTESIHIVEDQIYRRFIKDIALKKFTNINTIFETANKINEVIIKPNDGTWDTCRWYA